MAGFHAALTEHSAAKKDLGPMYSRAKEFAQALDDPNNTFMQLSEDGNVQMNLPGQMQITVPAEAFQPMMKDNTLSTALKELMTGNTNKAKTSRYISYLMTALHGYAARNIAAKGSTKEGESISQSGANEVSNENSQNDLSEQSAV